MRLLLASKSAARRAMLEAAAIPFASVEADVDEEALKMELRGAGLGAADLALRLAEAKALAAAAPRGSLVIGSDQTLETEGGAMIDKPASRDEALEQLRMLAGTTHRLHSAAVVAEQQTVVWHNVESVVLSMRPLSDSFLRDYLDREYEAIRWSVGGYRIEGPGVQLFDRIEGSHFAILGLPLLPLLAYLRTRGAVPA